MKDTSLVLLETSMASHLSTIGPIVHFQGREYYFVARSDADKAIEEAGKPGDRDDGIDLGQPPHFLK